jgi:glycerol-3-phosphate dehydrogenase (NAD(P)+)
LMLVWVGRGGLARVRRVAIIGAGTWGTALAVCLARAGLEVDLGCRTHEQAQALQSSRENARYLPGVTLPDAVRVLRAAELSPEGHDIVCLAVPAKALPAVLAAHGGRISSRVGVLVVSKGMVPPLGSLPAAFAAERCNARAVAVLGGPGHAADGLDRGASVVLASLDQGFARQLADALSVAKLDVSITTDVTGVELAGCATGAAALAAATASSAGANVAGAAAGKVFAEVDALARVRGGRPETFAGLAGAGDLVATVVAGASRGPRAEAVESVPMLASAAREAKLDSPALNGLAALVEGRLAPEQWAATVTEPSPSKRPRSIRAA